MATLDNTHILTLKAALSAGLGLSLTMALGIPDGVSAAFVAVICTSPTVLTGLKRAVAQTSGSLLGGGAGALCQMMEVSIVVRLTLSVWLGVSMVFLLRQGSAYLVAAFSAIYLVLIPWGGPGETLWVRFAAVLLGALAATVVNIGFSALFYRRIFERRIERVAEFVAGCLEQLSEGDVDAVLPAFPLIAALLSELDEAERELSFRKRQRAQLAYVRRSSERVRALGRLSHFSRDMGLVVIVDAGLPLTEGDVAVLRHIAARLRGQEAQAPEPSGEIGGRMLASMRRYLGEGVASPAAPVVAAPAPGAISGR